MRNPNPLPNQALRPLTDDELQRLADAMNAVCRQIVATFDMKDDPFHAVQIVTVSTDAIVGREKRIVIWLEPDNPLDYNWQPSAAFRPGESWIVEVGNGTDDPDYYGPFSNQAAAHRWAEDSDETVIIHVQPPSTAETEVEC